MAILIVAHIPDNTMKKTIWIIKCELRMKTHTIKEKIYYRIALYCDSLGKWSYLAMDRAKWNKMQAWTDKRDRPY